MIIPHPMYKWVNQHGQRLLLLVMLSVFPKVLFGQYLLYNDTPINIEASFTRHSIEASAQKTIFNVLVIKNKSNRQENLTLNLTVPQGWTIIGSEKSEITLNPLDSIILPIRVAVGAKIKGDIGYSIIASLTDNKGNTVQNIYCFVKIPRVVNLNIRYAGKLSYFDPINNSAEFSIIVKNKGNREEPINIFFDGNRQLLIGNQRQTLYSTDISIPPYTDSTFTFRTELKEEEFFGKNMFNLKSTVTTVDTTLRTTFWFRKIESTFKNYISPEDKPLTIELFAQGLLNNTKPTISAIIEGKTLFKGNSEVYYFYRNFKSEKSTDFYENTRMYLGGRFGSWRVEVGDNYRSFESFMFGRGGYLAYQNKRIKVELIHNKNHSSKLSNSGGALSFAPSTRTKLFTGAAFSKSNISDFNSRLGYIGSMFTILKKHNFYTLFGYNQLTRELNGKKEHTEYGGEFNYNSTTNRLNTSVRAEYGSKFYNSSKAGRFNIYANTLLSLNTLNKLSFYYTQNINSLPVIQNVTIINEPEMGNKAVKVEHHYSPSRNLLVFWGPSVESYKWSGVSNFLANKLFSSINYKMILGFRINNSLGTSSLMPKIEISQTKILNNPYNSDSTPRRNNSFGYQYFSLNFRNNSLNVLAYYTSGARSMLEQVNYANSSKPTRRLQFLPTFDRFVYKNIVKLTLGLSYTNDLVAKSTYSNITGQVYLFMPKDWRFYVLSVYSLQKRTNPQDNTETYQNLYVEASLKKEFSLQHPRVKFYDIDIVFFKDFNGDFIQGVNEPGVKNVLLNISREDSETIKNIPGDFYSVELLSDNLGRVTLEKIPEGLYKIVYNPIGKDAASTFTKALEEMTISVDKNKVLYIPFVEKNKVFGRIILNRSRLSGLGKLDLSNVRITSTDSKGRTYTTLTDRNGEFVLFAPVTDQYIVNINNIYYENFDLRQNNFKVQFNGYKQFEVNFVFDEKIRRINFSPSTQDSQLANVLQIRKTNLKGSVKDASNLLPIRAKVNLINTKTNTIMTSMYSSAQTGDYNMSFMAEDIYLLEIIADGYWYFAENLNLNQVTTFLNVTKDVMLKPIAIGSKIELNIKFEINKTDLAPEAVAELNRLIKLLKDNGNIKVEVQGHSDDLEALSNPQISEERAKKVARYLIENGFSNIQIRGFGNTVPVSSNDTEQGREANRRVEIEVVSK